MLVPIGSEDGCAVNALLARLLPHLAPQRGIESRHSEQRPVPTSGVDGHTRSPKTRLDGKGARAAHGVHQRFSGLPARQSQQARGQHLVERRPGPRRTVAPLEQGLLAHEVEGDRHFLPRDVQVDQLLRRRTVNVQVVCAAGTGRSLEVIAQCVLQAEHGELVVRKVLAVDRDIQ